MSFSRTLSGLAAEYLFYPEILVYVEGHTDIPFYSAVLQNYDCRIRTYREEKGCDKLTEELVKKDLPYVVIVDGHYEMLERTRSQHRRIVLLHRHSYENYLFETEPIEQFCRDYGASADSLEKLPLNFEAILENITIKFKELIILDVAHQRAETGYDALPDRSDRFFKSQTGVDFLDGQIQQWQTEATNCIDSQNIDNARTLVEEFSRKRRFIDLLPGHFAFGIIRRFIIDTISRRISNISNDQIRVYLSRLVWQLVRTNDHNSLKRRLRKAFREAERIRQASNSQAQSNARS